MLANCGDDVIRSLVAGQRAFVMHELSVAHAVVATVVEAMPDPHIRVSRVSLRLGKLTGVEPQALDFAYDVAAAGTPLEGSTLAVEELPIMLMCSNCGEQESIGLSEYDCPVCGQTCADLVGGKELEVAAVTFRNRVVADALDEGALARNDLLADGLRGWFTVNQVNVSNWVSGPGAGKTTLLQALLSAAVARGLGAAALVSDHRSENHARTLACSGANLRKMMTRGLCHLESDMVSAHLDGWELSDLDLLAIENIGNLACPTNYDLGEDTRVVLLSVTDAEHKSPSYPQTLDAADVVVLTKVDVADDAQRRRAVAAVRGVAPDAAILETSARTGEGVQELLELLLDPDGAQSYDASRMQEATQSEDFGVDTEFYLLLAD